MHVESRARHAARRGCLDNQHLVRWKQGAAESGSCYLFTCLARETRHEVKSSSDVPELVCFDSNDGQVHSRLFFLSSDSLLL